MYTSLCKVQHKRSPSKTHSGVGVVKRVAKCCASTSGECTNLVVAEGLELGVRVGVLLLLPGVVVGVLLGVVELASVLSCCLDTARLHSTALPQRLCVVRKAGGKKTCGTTKGEVESTHTSLH